MVQNFLYVFIGTSLSILSISNTALGDCRYYVAPLAINFRYAQVFPIEKTNSLLLRSLSAAKRASTYNSTIDAANRRCNHFRRTN